MTFDRRYIFVLIALAVMIPILLPLGLPVRISAETEAVYDRIEGLPPGSVVMVSFDHEASSLPEVRPMAEAVINHCFKKNINIVGLALFAEGTAIGYQILNRLGQEWGKTYGKDYVYLGYRPQYSAAILGMGESIRQVFPRDYNETSYMEIPLLREIEDYDNIALVISVADGSLPTYWVEYARARYDQEIVTALTAVMVTAYTPYMDAGQIGGIVGGLKGAAEYEKILGTEAAGKRGMDAQSMAHLVIAVMVIIGNVLSFTWRKSGKRAGDRRGEA